jgi:rhamnose utilization protein RhaD (predicted bifunctional aldolase and dehydrogenase)
MIDADRCSRAVQYLIDSAAEYGAARADQARSEHMLKVVRALAMKASGENSAAAQEREALASDAYVDAIGEVFEATKSAETLRAKREAAVQTIEYWRSQNANQRAAERGYGSVR